MNYRRNRRLLYNLVFVLLILGGPLSSRAQCFEIESILVDACNSPEGENEMVIFQVGTNALNTSNLTVSWPNSFNPWRSTCQNATTASKVASMNATILRCGFLLEPVNGVLPAGSRVLLITSEDYDVASHSFANLTDTLYVIFQCSGNTNGHFANATASGTRTLTMTFTGGGGCSDNVSYDTQQLVDINGNTGSGGSTTARNGSSVAYTPSGAATYFNNGCQLPYNPPTLSAGSDQTVCTNVISINLNGTASQLGGYALTWSGGSGTFSNTGSLQTTYTFGTGDVSGFPLVLIASNGCDSVRDTINIFFAASGGATIDAGVDTSGCPGEVINFSGVGPIQAGATYQWSGGNGAYSAGNSLNTAYTIVDGDTGGVWIFLSFTDTCGIVTTDSLFLTVPNTLLGAVAATDTVCYQDTIRFEYTGNATNFNWSSPNFAFLGRRDTSFAVFRPLPTDIGILIPITLIYDNGCESDTITRTFEQLPDVLPAFEWIPDTTWVGRSVEFVNAQNPNEVRWNWDFGDGTSSTLVNPYHAWDNPGGQSVTLTGYDIFDCPGDRVQTVVVLPVDTAFPNVFSPNGDGINDVLEFTMPELVMKYELRIFDRWGSEVFVSNSKNDHWDGRLPNGEEAVEGVYFWILKAYISEPLNIVKTGNATLLR